MTTIIVVAAIVERGDTILITRRQPGVHLAGHWEFPGGKCEPGETLKEGLARELREELNVDAVPGVEVLVTTHDYPERRVELHFLKCELKSEPVPQLGQDMRWVKRNELTSFTFPPADTALIRILTERTADS